MALKILVNKNNPPLGALITAQFVKKGPAPISVKIEWSTTTSLKINDDIDFNTTNSISRYLARLAPEKNLYGKTILEKTEVDHWLSYSIGPMTKSCELTNVISYLDKVLGPVTYLVGATITLADIVVWGTLYTNNLWQTALEEGIIPSHLLRWYKFLQVQDEFQQVLQVVASKSAIKTPLIAKKGQNKDVGKFVDLPDAEMGKVVVRFPPEASGFLHIGHAKAALLNQYYQKMFNGKLIMRFDDTNPEKEKSDFEKVILEDLELLEVEPDKFSFTSDYFDIILSYCEQLLRQGKAYADDTDAELMKQEREQKKDSKNRNNIIKQNMQMWEEMKRGTEYGQKCCIRAKIDMQSVNGCMRDPTIYRCKTVPHARTKDKYSVYPTYDFACPIVDSIEGVTHSLRTTEYHDRDEQFYWFLDQLQLRKPHIWEYARLNMTHTVLSKRKLTWFVEEGLVDGWDDPRFPTVRGILRHGMTVDGLKQFIIAQGGSRHVVNMEWDKIWAFNKKVIDPIAPRYTALEKNYLVTVHVEGAKIEKITAAKHPKNSDVGNKEICVGPEILIEGADAEQLKGGENATFINWGNLLITRVQRNADGMVTSVNAKLDLDNKDYKKTLKLTWISSAKESPRIPCVCVHFDHLINKAVLDREEDFKSFIGTNTRHEVQMLGEHELANVKKSEIIQLQRKGFYICDSPYEPLSRYSSRESPIILYYIPDGHSTKEKEMSPKEAARSAMGKSAEKSPLEEAGPVAGGDAASLDEQIQKQGGKVRALKSSKAPKPQIEEEVKMLLSLKASYKNLTGKDWQQSSTAGKASAPQTKVASDEKCVAESTAGGDASAVDAQIKLQGDKIRALKSSKAPKPQIEEEVKTLLSLKTSYKNLTGKDWQPNAISEASSAASKSNVPQNKGALDGKSLAGEDASALDAQIRLQGEKVRGLKSSKAPKSQVDEEVKVLLSLKASYKTATGKDWSPSAAAPSSAPKSISKEEVACKSMSDTSTAKNVADSPAATKLKADIDAQGDLVRQLKGSAASKVEIDDAVSKLLTLKSNYKDLTGVDLAASGGGGKKGKQKPNKQEKKKDTTPEPKDSKSETMMEPKSKAAENLKKQTRLGLEVTKEENLSEWYSQVITKAEMIEYYDVSGCYILRPWSYAIWEAIKNFFDTEIRRLGVQNCYFPMFVSQAALEKEKTHIADFSPEVAWVTKSGQSDMAEPIAIRPTSETVMYPSYSKWIKSHRDLPLKLNQWCNVVRWEFKHPQPFLRTREFLWQEGHTAFATQEEAEAEVFQILELYRRVYEELLAIPVVEGKKTEKEKFAGGNFTTTVEAYVLASGRGLQGATSHYLGQNFSKMFEILYEDPDTNEKKFVHQNSWGLSTRTIGAMVMIHADNTGLVLPPRVASVQAIIIPCGITVNLPEDKKKALLKKCEEYEQRLCKANIRCKGDYRDNYSPGWKFNHWELKGVPIRIELGPKDMQNNECVAVRRDTGEKLTFKDADLCQEMKNLLDNIHESMFNKAKKGFDEHYCECSDWSDFTSKLEKKFVILALFCGDPECEERIKKDSARGEDTVGGEAQGPSMGAKSLCIPFKDSNRKILPNDRCIHPECKNKPAAYTMFGRSY